MKSPSVGYPDRLTTARPHARAGRRRYVRAVTDSTAPTALPGTHPRRKRRPGFVWELIGCAQHGHALVGSRSVSLDPADPHLAREMQGIRWHRCLRCDAWLPVAPPAAPERDGLPTREEIELPLRGRPLRDRYVLRIIAIDRAAHFLLLVLVVAGLLLLAVNRTRYQADVARLINDFQAGAGGPQADTGHGLLGEFRKLTDLSTTRVYQLAVAAAVYAILEGAEAFGLWWGRRWAEYLTFVGTIALLPLEIYELSNKVSVLKLFTLVLNLAVACYLLWAKRLFGVRGGGAHELAQKEYDSGWAAVERLSPEAFAGAGLGFRAPYSEVVEHHAAED
ncbi:MAG: hypothetical protein QOI76_943 [Frankiales bacterium]|nr:hypothetical protein [Frankiales bacterium]